jgi:hypothetical protein
MHKRYGDPLTYQNIGTNLTAPGPNSLRRIACWRRDAAAKAALQAIGRESLMGYTDEELVVYEDTYDSVIRALMNEEPFT